VATDTPDIGPARGPIIISRHGKPALDRNAGPRLSWEEYADWWARYEIGSLAEGQIAPDDLKQIVADAKLVLTSMRPRAQETAALAATHMEAIRSDLFNEAPLPPPRWKRARYLPKTWNVIARGMWMRGHTLTEEDEHISATKQRAEAAAKYLDEHAAAGKVYLAAHGWFNWMLRPEIKKLGWKCTHDGGNSYWSYRVYEWRGD